MKQFNYVRATDTAAALDAANGALMANTGPCRFLAGGTNLVDLMKEEVEHPATVIDINRLPLAVIERRPNGVLRLGALATNAATARHPLVLDKYPLLASAILAGASPQLRNAATNGGNLNQRTRCYYFYDSAAACNKREPGTGCGAIGGLTRIHAILGASEQCIATHPSDLCVALLALDATVRVSGTNGERAIAIGDYHRLPEDQPWRDNTLEAGELVTSIDLPDEDFSAHFSYLKLRDRLSYAFALVSVAAAMRFAADGTVDEARIAVGGVSHKPWRVPDAEAMLNGSAPSASLYRAVAERIILGAVGQGGNDFKIELAKRAITRALQQAAAGKPQSQSSKRIA
jgi:xanthine dehydrogenase YagS FAD-binding subunit